MIAAIAEAKPLFLLHSALASRLPHVAMYLTTNRDAKGVGEMYKHIPIRLPVLAGGRL